MKPITWKKATLWRGNVWSAVVAHAVLNLFIVPALFQNALESGFDKAGM